MTYENPVWHDYFADPFVLRHGGRYYAYGTGAAALQADGRAFPILQSDDLVRWRYVGGAVRPPAGATACWAPEVAEEAGKFYLYYSAASGPGDESHRLRVAIADAPTGPFVDSGHEIFPELGFTIDAHPFRDPVTGQWHLFFAQDYTDADPTGTGVGVVRMKDMLRPDGQPVVVTRGGQEWQVYERNRDYKGRTWPAWYTAEGPSVIFHDNRYWCFYSGGRWSSEGYGVGFAVADSPLGPWRDEMAAHGPTVLKTIAGRVIGPGHNCVATAPDGRLMMVYHAWDAALTMRRMCIDPLRWTATGPVCDGPSTGPRVLDTPQMSA